MDARAYLPAHERAMTPLSFYRRIECLSLFFTPEEIVELSHQFQGYQDAELLRLATSFHRQCMHLALGSLPQ
jgi:hypothetical protein